MKRSSLLILLAVGTLIAAYQAYEHGWIRLNYPSAGRYPIGGVDVSHHRGDIDWAAVRREGMVFAYITATDGGVIVDPQLRANSTQARAAVLAVVAYHYFIFGRDGASQ